MRRDLFSDRHVVAVADRAFHSLSGIAAIDNLLQDYVRTAKAKGVSNRRVLWGHVFKNAMLSTVTLVGLSLPGVVSGAVVTETVFNYPGVGYLFWTSAQNRDYPS